MTTARPSSELRQAFPSINFHDLPEVPQALKKTRGPRQVWWYVPEECRGITAEESRRLFNKEGRSP